MQIFAGNTSLGYIGNWVNDKVTRVPLISMLKCTDEFSKIYMENSIKMRMR